MPIKLQAGKFYGETARSLNLSGFCLTEKSYEPHSDLPRHAHELAHFCFVLAGRYTEKLGSRCEERTPHSFIYYPPDISHAENHHSAGRHFLIELDRVRADSLRDYGVLLNEPFSGGGKSSWLLPKIYREFRNMDSLSMLALEGMVIELIAETLRGRAIHNERRSPKWLEEVIQILEANFSEPPSLNQLAKTVGVHPVHLVRAFRKYQHCTMGEYIRERRIEYARRRIISSDAPLVEIALACGFADHAHFSHSFKRVTGMTPSEFRRIVSPC